jgi:GNAT superfamily N-acetyltransferase
MARTIDDLALFSDAFSRQGSQKSTEHLRWQYFDNPAASLLVDFAIDESNGCAAAIHGVWPVRVRVAGRVVRAGLSLNVLTDSGYRGRGLFVKLASRVYERCAGDGLAFVYGFPNENSAHGFWTHLGWSSLDPVPAMVRPLSLRYYLRRTPLTRPFCRAEREPSCLPLESEAANQGNVQVLCDFGAETDELWHEFGRNVGIAIERDHDFMDWRFKRKPDRDYSIVVYRDRKRLDALVVYAVTGGGGETVGHVMELLHRADASDAALILLKRTLAVFRRCGCTAAYCACLAHSPNYGVFQKAGFIARPALFRKSQLHFGVKPLVGSDAAFLASRENWYISHADYDTI